MNGYLKTSIIATSLVLSQLPALDETGDSMDDLPFETNIATPNYVIDSALPTATGVPASDWQSGIS